VAAKLTDVNGEHEPMSDAVPVGYCEARLEPLSDYLGNIEFVSSSQLRRFARSGLTGLQLPDAGVVTGTVMGEAFHALVLEPEAFERGYLVLLDAAGDQHAVSEQGLMDRTWLDAWQWSALCGARNALLACKQAPLADWLANGRKELSIYWRDEEGIGWKARPDCLAPGIVFDLKTTSDCRPEAFRRTRQRFDYDLQAAHYVETVAHLTGQEPRFAFVAVELNAPYAVWVHELCGSEIDTARARLGELKKAYIEASRAAGTGTTSQE
jgi:hypothetical protein